jgi:putative FmdB family regulatory protein
VPIYEYKCEGCGETFEVIQKFADEPVHRLMSAPSFQFKGSGWYVTDYAKGSGSSPAHTESGKSEQGHGEKSESGKSESGKSESGKSDGGHKTESSSKGSGDTATKTETKSDSKPSPSTSSKND